MCAPLGCRGDDAGRCALLQPLEEELAEQKRREVVDRPGQFDANAIGGTCDQNLFVVHGTANQTEMTRENDARSYKLSDEPNRCNVHLAEF